MQMPEDKRTYKIVIRFTIFTSFEVLPLDQSLKSLLDSERVGGESRCQLPGDLVHEFVMLHMLPVLHNPHNTSLQGIVNRCRWRTFGGRLTSIWCFLSSSIFPCVSCLSWLFSGREDTVLILILCILSVKSTLNEKESSLLISLPAGCFFSTLYFAHAKDWRFLFRSASSINVASLISCEGC